MSRVSSATKGGSMFDLVVRGGQLIDGTGGEPFSADVGITDGRIAYIGSDADPGRDEVDAQGRLVTPGFIDVHSHLDGNATFESRLKPNSGHGVTSTVIGNCGVGFAPCRPEHRAFQVALMEGVEDVPASLLNAAITWRWQSYPEFLDVLAGRRYDMNVAGLVPHSCLRTWVMGERAIAGEPATDADLKAIRSLVREAMQAGAVGVASTRLVGQKTLDGIHCPSLGADFQEYLAIAEAMASVGEGVLQIAPEFNQFPRALEELQMMLDVVERSGVRLTYSLKQTNTHPDGWRELLDMTAAAQVRGARVAPQVLARPTGAIISWECSFHPFARCAAYAPLSELPLTERLNALKRPDTRHQLLDEAQRLRQAAPERYQRQQQLLFPVGSEVDYEPTPEQSVSAIAERTGQSAIEVIYDSLLAHNGKGCLLMTSGNYAQFSLEPAREMLAFAGAIPGLGDAGAHSSVICDASSTTYMLSYWTRDRTLGPRFSVSEIVRKMTDDCAEFFGFKDRGRLEVGMVADINVLDYEKLRLLPPQMTYDLPAGGRRLVQKSEGYDATIVAGQIVHRFDQQTSALSGRLLKARSST